MKNKHAGRLPDGTGPWTQARERIYAVPVFRRVLQRERARADRNSHGFSLAIFNFRDAGETGRQVASEVITGRIRFTDEIGWVDPHRLGVVLPDTYQEGASFFGDSMLRSLTLGGVKAECKVYTYTGGYRPGEHGEGPSQLWFQELADMPVGSVTPPHAQLCNEGIEPYLAEPHPLSKRLLDIAGASLALLVLSPLMLFIAGLIKLVSRGPVFFRQERVGYMGKTFQCLKFRTMHTHAPVTSHQKHLQQLIGSDAPMTKLERTDPRIIPLGRLLRAAALDELPQLINVLRGEMSLIGPRPCIPYEYQEYQNWQRRRVGTAPGLTGLWQVSGKNQTTFKEMMRLDIAYAQKRSLWLDLRILARTLPVILQQVRDMLRPRPPARPPASQPCARTTSPAM